MLLALMLLNIFGYDHVSDVDMLENDQALGKLIRRLEPDLFGRRRSIHDWLLRFHDATGVKREYGTSHIPHLSKTFTSLCHLRVV